MTLIMAGVILLAYYALFLWDLRRGFVKLGRYPYNQFRVGNRLLRIQVPGDGFLGAEHVVPRARVERRAPEPGPASDRMPSRGRRRALREPRAALISPPSRRCNKLPQIRVRVMTAIGFVICCILYTCVGHGDAVGSSRARRDAPILLARPREPSWGRDRRNTPPPPHARRLAPPNVCVAYWISFLGYLPMQVRQELVVCVRMCGEEEGMWEHAGVPGRGTVRHPICGRGNPPPQSPQVLMTALAAVNTFLLCPIKPSEHSILLVGWGRGKRPTGLLPGSACGFPPFSA